jgi:hypothetical protein
MSKYNKAIALAIRQVPKPFPVHTDVAEHPDFLEIRIYENQIMEYEEAQRVVIMDYLLKVRDVVQLHGVRCELMGVAGDPPRTN